MDDRYIIDSSVFVAFYYEGDVHHNSAVEILKSIEDNFIVIHPYVISEVATVLTYKVSKELSDIFISDIMATENVHIITPDITGESNFFVEQSRKMSFVDTSLVYWAKRMSVNLVTFDRQILSLLKK